MSDVRLRDLERRWRESGAALDEGAYLAECLRAGRLERRGLELLAEAGDAASAGALGQPPRGATLDEGWVRALAAWGGLPMIRAMAAAARLLLPSWTAAHPDDPSPAAGLADLEAWLVCPCAEHARALVESVGHHDSLWSCLALAVDGSNRMRRPRAASAFVLAAAQEVGGGRVLDAIRAELKASLHAVLARTA